MADPSVVQSKTSTEVASGATSTSVTLDAAPTTGNLLLAIVELNAAGSNITVPPSGFNLELAYERAATSVCVRIYSRIAQAGDTTGPYSVTVTGTSRFPRITVIEIANQARLVDWRVWLPYAASYTSGLITTGLTRSITVPVPALVLSVCTMALAGTAGNITGPTEPYWTSVIAAGAGGSTSSNHTFHAALLSESSNPSGGTLDHTIRVNVASAHSYSQLSFLAIRGDPPTPATGDVQIVQKKVSARSATTTASLTLDTAPTPGNMLLALMAWKGNGSDDLTDVTGWTEQYERDNSTGNIHVMWLSHLVAGGDSSTISFTINPAAQGTTSQPILYVFEIKNQGTGTTWRGGFGNAGVAAGQGVATYTLPTTYKPALILVAWETVYNGTGVDTYTPAPPTESGWATYVYHTGQPYLPTNDFAGYANIFGKIQPGATRPAGGPEQLTTGVAAANPHVGTMIDYVIIYPNDTGTVSAFVDVEAAEVVSQNTNTEVRIDQITAETVSQAAAIAHVDATYVEVVRTPGPSEANVDAVYAEVVTPYTPPSAQLQLDATFLEAVVQYPNQAGSFGLNVDTIYLEVVVPQGTVIAPPTIGNPLIPLIC